MSRLEYSRQLGNGLSRGNRRNKKRKFFFIVAAVVLLLVAAFFTMCALGSEKDLVTEGEKKNADTTPILGGAELIMLKSQTRGQMMSFLIETKDGELIVIDGGRWDDGDYLMEQIRARGGRVTAWFLTHTHTDHVGALIKVLQDEEAGVDTGIIVDKFYYNFAPKEWYITHEPDDVGTAYTIMELLERLPQEKIQIVHKGDVITVDDVTVTAMNDPYIPDEEHIGDNDGNDCGLAYRAVVNDVSILFLGDLGVIGGERLLEQNDGNLKSDMVQMAHHGQDGVGEKVYQAVDPSICLWPTPQWLWENTDGQFKTPETKKWIRKLNVKKHYCTKDGDQVVR